MDNLDTEGGSGEDRLIKRGVVISGGDSIDTLGTSGEDRES